MKPYEDQMKSPRERAAALLAELSLDEKMAQLSCVFPFGEKAQDFEWIAAQVPQGVGQVSTLEMRRIRTLEDCAAWQRQVQEIFYRSFVSGLMQTLELPEDCRDELLVNSNLVMQMLDEKGLSPYKTFESISRFAELLSACRDGAFSPRITQHRITDNTQITLIEPPCGSNTAILQSGGEVLFIDCGYAMYRREMEKIFRQLLPGWDSMRKRILITHADVDHCGLLPLFDEVLASEKSRECLALEYAAKPGFREQNPMHRPYISICKTLTRYVPPEPEKVHGLWSTSDGQEAPLAQMGFFRFGDLCFEVYQGAGGHLKGETVLIDFTHHIAFTGDIYVNIHGMTREQAAYNQYAPVLMTSVDTDPKLCAEERRAVMQRLGVGQWQIFGAHGMKKDYGVMGEK